MNIDAAIIYHSVPALSLKQAFKVDDKATIFDMHLQLFPKFFTIRTAMRQSENCDMNLYEESEIDHF